MVTLVMVGLRVLGLKLIRLTLERRDEIIALPKGADGKKFGDSVIERAA